MKYGFTVRTTFGAPPDRAKRELEEARRRAGNELYKIIYSQKLPVVIDIEEETVMPDYQWGEPFQQELRITVTITPVAHRHVTIEHADYDFPKPKPAGILRRLLKRITRQ